MSNKAEGSGSKMRNSEYIRLWERSSELLAQIKAGTSSVLDGAGEYRNDAIVVADDIADFLSSWSAEIEDDESSDAELALYGDLDARWISITSFISLDDAIDALEVRVGGKGKASTVEPEDVQNLIHLAYLLGQRGGYRRTRRALKILKAVSASRAATEALPQAGLDELDYQLSRAYFKVGKHKAAFAILEDLERRQIEQYGPDSSEVVRTRSTYSYLKNRHDDGWSKVVGSAVGAANDAAPHPLDIAADATKSTVGFDEEIDKTLSVKSNVDVVKDAAIETRRHTSNTQNHTSDS